ncbi:glycoside hydrolase family 3 N-terminal domain-containing protein [Chloroflexota bacterium]
MSILFRILKVKISIVIILISILMLTLPGFEVVAQTVTTTPESQAAGVLNNLTPEEKIGQLFMITFVGTDVGPESEIYDLITNYHIGNIVILAENDNLTYINQSPGDTALQLRALTRDIQQTEWNASHQSQENPSSGDIFVPSFIPLLIGMSQEGDGYSYDQVLFGLMPLPNHIALGSTWNPELAAEVGTILGSELTSVGINLLLGPSLDILESPQSEGTNDLGARTFGGDPYWVAEMGRAYISGVHTGSVGRVVVVAKHFPGHGGADRLPEDEVATIRKSLEELITFDLAPFFTVTGDALSPEETTDALLTSHIRYQGLQGNIRATTRPVSLDPQALNLLLEQPILDSWRQNGGVMISDNLSSPAVRRFYELTSQTFDPRRVALNAFLAGNDLLYMADFSSETDPDSYTSTVGTLDFFAQKYREDNVFAQRVDESVLRILNLKYKLYGKDSLDQIIAEPNISIELEEADQVVFEVARQGATLISPSQAELDETIPDPPNQNDRIVFISDSRATQQCSQCTEQPILGVRALQEFVIRRYGPLAGGQVTQSNLSSYSLANLENMLDGSLPDSQQLQNDLIRSNWIVFAMLDNSTEVPSYQTLIRFLNERPDLFQQKRLIVFAFNAPYFLDATNISKITAFYGLYSKIPQFIDLSAYLLFHEIQPRSASPVSISGINYDLNTALFPNPEQIIPLEIDVSEPENPNDATTPEPTPPPEFRVGDLIPVRTGTIFDHNGNPVPDGTPVDFILTVSGEASITQQMETTVDGIARTSFAVSSPGTLEIQAESEPAKSMSLKFDVPSPNGEAALAEQTTPATSPPTNFPTKVSNPIPIKPPSLPGTSNHPRLSDWLMAILISIAIAWSSYRLAALIGHVKWGIRAGFLALISGLLAYSFLAYQLPTSQSLLGGSISMSVFFITLLGTVIGLLVALSWRALSIRRIQSEDPED